MSGTFDISTFTANRATASDSFAVYGNAALNLQEDKFPQNFSPVYFATTSICELPAQQIEIFPVQLSAIYFKRNGKLLVRNFTTNGTFTINATASFTENSDTGKQR